MSLISAITARGHMRTAQSLYLIRGVSKLM